MRSHKVPGACSKAEMGISACKENLAPTHKAATPFCYSHATVTYRQDYYSRTNLYAAITIHIYYMTEVWCRAPVTGFIFDLMQSRYRYRFRAQDAATYLKMSWLEQTGQKVCDPSMHSTCTRIIKQPSAEGVTGSNTSSIVQRRKMSNVP